MANERIGSAFDNLFEEEGLLEEAENTAVKRIIAWQIKEQMKARHINKNKMAELTKTSRAQLDRLLDPDNNKVQLDTIQRAAAAMGCRLLMSLKPVAPR